jgi:hypothetical protein
LLRDKTLDFSPIYIHFINESKFGGNISMYYGHIPRNPVTLCESNQIQKIKEIAELFSKELTLPEGGSDLIVSKLQCIQPSWITLSRREIEEQLILYFDSQPDIIIMATTCLLKDHIVPVMSSVNASLKKMVSQPFTPIESEHYLHSLLRVLSFSEVDSLVNEDNEPVITTMPENVSLTG